MYGTNQEIATINDRFEVKRDNKVKFVKAVYEKLPGDTTGMNLYFVDAVTGVELKDSHYDVTLQTVRKFSDETNEQAYQRSCRQTNSIIRAVLGIFLTDAELDAMPTYGSLEDFAAGITTVLANKDLNTVFWLKTIKSNKGFARLPYTSTKSNPCVAPLVEGQPCPLQYTDKEEKANSAVITNVTGAISEPSSNISNNPIQSNTKTTEGTISRPVSNW